MRRYNNKFVTLFAALLVSPVAIAQDNTTADATINVEAQPLAAALKDFSDQTGLQLAYVATLAENKTSNGVENAASPVDALDAILDSTGLEYQFVNDETIAIGKAPDQGGNSDQKNVGSAPILMAQNMSQTTSSGSSAGGGSEAREDSDEEEAERIEQARGRIEALVIDEIIVRGTHNTGIRRSEDDAQPYVVFDRQQIELSNSPNVEEFLKRNLPSETSVGTGVQEFSLEGNISEFSLRGLGSDETLILVDGRRVTGSRFSQSVNQGDINNIPISAIERIEVLPTAASGIYGGGATGGVINIILRRDYRGLEAGVNYQDVFNGSAGEYTVDLSGGSSFNDGKTWVSFSASLQDSTSELTVSERPFFDDRRSLVLQNDPDTFFSSSTPPLGSTTNVRSRNGENLVLRDGTDLGSLFTSIPVGYAGMGSDGGAGLVENAGTYNFDLANTFQAEGGGLQSLRLQPRVQSVRGSLAHDLTPWLEVFFEGALSENRSEGTQTSDDGVFTLPEGAPGNPFLQEVRVTVPLIGAENTRVSISENLRLGTGFIAKLNDDWSLGFDLTLDETTSEYIEEAFQFDAAAADVAVEAGEIDIFRDLNVFDAGFDQFLAPTRTGISPTSSSLVNLALRTSGALPFLLPGGKPVLSSSFEYRTEEYGEIVSRTSVFSNGVESVEARVSPERSQDVFGLYAEVLFPLIGEENQIFGVHMLEFQTALRTDWYEINAATNSVDLDDDGELEDPIVRTTSKLSSTNPSFALRYAPVKDVTFRASYATGFLPPSVTQLTSTVPINPIRSFIWGIFDITDPLRGDEVLGSATENGGVFVLAGGNPDLEPEETESISAGIIFTPRFAPDLRFSADWTRIDKTDAITTLPSFFREGVPLMLESAPERVTRAEPIAGDGFDVGPITQLDFGLINFERQDIEVLDLSADYTWSSLNFGDFTLNVEASHFIKSERQLNPDADLDVFKGTAGALDWKVSGSLTWVRGPWNARWATQYYDQYKIFSSGEVDERQGSAFIDSQIYHDLFFSYRFDEGNFADSSILSGAQINFGISNVFNTDPPIIARGPGGYSRIGDPRLARYTIGFRKPF